MKNIAKCKICKSIIESLHRTDYVTCKCNQISVYGGPDLMQCSALDWSNFVRIDDKGNEIMIKVVDSNTKAELKSEETPKSFAKQDLLLYLTSMIETIDRLPHGAMQSPISHIDFMSLLLVISAWLKSDLKDT